MSCPPSFGWRTFQTSEPNSDAYRCLSPLGLQGRSRWQKIDSHTHIHPGQQASVLRSFAFPPSTSRVRREVQRALDLLIDPTDNSVKSATDRASARCHYSKRRRYLPSGVPASTILCEAPVRKRVTPCRVDKATALRGPGGPVQVESSVEYDRANGDFRGSLVPMSFDVGRRRLSFRNG